MYIRGGLMAQSVKCQTVLISDWVMVSGLWDWALLWALCWVWSLLEILFLSLPRPLCGPHPWACVCTLSFSLKKKKSCLFCVYKHAVFESVYVFWYLAHFLANSNWFLKRLSDILGGIDPLCTRLNIFPRKCYLCKMKFKNQGRKARERVAAL